MNLKQDMRDIPTFKEINACNFFILTVDPYEYSLSPTTQENLEMLRMGGCVERGIGSNLMIGLT